MLTKTLTTDKIVPYMAKIFTVFMNLGSFFSASAENLESGPGAECVACGGT